VKKLFFIACFIASTTSLLSQTKLSEEQAACILARCAAHDNTMTTTLESELLDACKAGDLALVKKLIKEPGIDLNKGDEYGCTPLLIAAQQRDSRTLELLLSLKKSDGSFAVNVNKSNMDGVTPLLAACQKRDDRTIENLLTVPGIDVNKADNNGETPLLVVCKNKSVDPSIVDALLKDGAVNTANKKGETPLEITKDTLLYGLLEFYLVGEVHASKFCGALSAKDCKDMREEDLRRRKPKEGIAFHE
jgi:ankyrin repeat protein